MAMYSFVLNYQNIVLFFFYDQLWMCFWLNPDLWLCVEFFSHAELLEDDFGIWFRIKYVHAVNLNYLGMSMNAMWAKF